MIDQNLYAIAAGYDVALVSLIRLTSVIATGDTMPFRAPSARGYYEQGKELTTLDGIAFYGGYALTGWFWAAMSWPQYVYLYSTILGGSFSGPVTIYTRLGPLGSADTYYRMNAVLTLPQITAIDGKFYAPRKILASLTRLRTAA